MGRFVCPEREAIQLCAFCVQAELGRLLLVFFLTPLTPRSTSTIAHQPVLARGPPLSTGDYNPTRHLPGYLAEAILLPDQDTAAENEIARAHRNLEYVGRAALAMRQASISPCRVAFFLFSFPHASLPPFPPLFSHPTPSPSPLTSHPDT